MTERDIQFIQRKTKLSRANVALLCEEEQDLDLVIEQIVSKRLVKRDLNGLSFKLYTKIVVFTATAKTNFDLAEKSIVSNIIGDLFPKLNNRTHFGPFIKKITPKPSEIGAKYFFVISSLFNDKVNCKDPEPEQIKYIAAGLSCLHPSFYKHIGEWFGILRDLKSSGKFRVNIMEEKIPELESCPRYSKGAKNLMNGS